MKNFILFLLVFLCATTGTLEAQQTVETKLPIIQIQNLPTGHIMVGSATGNTTIERLASNLTVTPPSGYVATNQQGLNNAFATNIAALQAGGSDGVVTAVNVTGTTTKTINVTRSVGAPLTANFDDNVNDADASATNEIQVVTRTANNISVSLGGGTQSVADLPTYTVFTPTSGNTITLTTAPAAAYLTSMRVFRNGLEQSIGTSGTSSDVTVAASTLTFNYRAFSAGDIVRVVYIAN